MKGVKKALPELVHSYTELEARVEALLSGYDHYVRPRAARLKLISSQELNNCH